MKKARSKINRPSAKRSKGSKKLRTSSTKIKVLKFFFVAEAENNTMVIPRTPEATKTEPEVTT